MRADGFTFAVRVARQINCIGSLSCFPEVVDDLNFPGNYLVGRLKNISGSDHYRLGGFFLGCGVRAFGFFRLALLLFSLAVLLAGQKDTNRRFRQIHHVAVGSLDRVVPAEILIDCFRLGGRFDDYQ